MTSQSLQDENPINERMDVAQIVIGDSGTQRYGGFFMEEPNQEWRDDERIDNVELMRRTDGTVKAVLEALKAPMLSTEWDVRSPDDSPLGKDILMHCKDSIFNLKSRTFFQMLRESLNYLDFGFSVAELIWGFRNGRATVVDIQPRIQASIQDWQLPDGRRGVTQRIRTDESDKFVAEIPMEKLIVLTNDKEGDDVTGQSVLRPAWKHFYAKDKLYRIGLIASERQGIGVPVIYLPDSYGAQEKAKADEMLKNFRASELARMILPDGWKFEVITPNSTGQGQIIEKQVDHHDRMILRSCLMGFIGLTSGDGGSEALSRDQSSYALKKVEDHATYVAEQFTIQVIHRIVRNAYPEHFERLKREGLLPRLEHMPLGDIDFKELSEVIKTLSEAQAIRMNPRFQQFVHQAFKLPEISDKEVDEMEKEEEEKKEAAPKAVPVPAEPEEDGPDEDDDGGDEEMYEHHGDCGCHVSLAEKKKIKFWRELTPLENKSSYQFLNENFNTLESQLEDNLVVVARTSLDKLKKRVERLLKNGELGAIAEMEFVSQREMKAALKKTIADAYNIGKQSAADEIDVERGPTPTQDTQTMNYDSSELANQFKAAVEGAAKETAKQSVINNVAPAAAVGAVVIAASDIASRMTANLIGTTVGENINRGRRAVFQQNAPQISGYMRSEILDDRTCNMCLSLDQRIVKPDDPMAKLNAVHSNCRGVWIPITTGDITETIVHRDVRTGKTKEIVVEDALRKGVLDVPKSVFKNFKTVGGTPVINSFTQLKKPINRSNEEVQKIVTKKIEE